MPLCRSGEYDFDGARPTSRGRKGRWNFEATKAEAAKYNTRKEFAVGSRTAYRHAHKMGWMDDICGHMAMRNHWDFEALLKEARKHKTSTDLRKACRPAYDKICRNEEWKAVCFAHFKQKRHGLTFEDCMEEAKKHDSKKSLRKANYTVYNKIVRNKDWAEKIFAHYNDRPYQRWDFDTCKAEAEKYTTTKALRTEAAGAYAAIIRNGWRDQLMAHLDSSRQEQD